MLEKLKAEVCRANLDVVVAGLVIETWGNVSGIDRQRGLVVTDDTAACELIGQPVQLVLSSRPNPKVTRPEDLPCVEALLGVRARTE